MQLSSRILTALAVLILAVAVVAVRAGSPGTVEAATGTIDVLNVGTCYTTDTDVFAVGACDDGDGRQQRRHRHRDNSGYNVAERRRDHQGRIMSLPPTPSTRRHRVMNLARSRRMLMSSRSASMTRDGTRGQGRFIGRYSAAAPAVG